MSKFRERSDMVEDAENSAIKQSANSVRETQRKIKEQYGSLFHQVVDIFYRHDPIDLAVCGAPPGEYEGETSKILPQLENAASVSEARRIIYDVFDRSFNYGSGTDKSRTVRISDDEAGAETDYQVIAEEVWAVWQTFDCAENKAP